MYTIRPKCLLYLAVATGGKTANRSHVGDCDVSSPKATMCTVILFGETLRVKLIGTVQQNSKGYPIAQLLEVLGMSGVFQQAWS